MKRNKLWRRCCAHNELVVKEEGEYLNMLSLFPSLFITSYEDIRGFHGKYLHIKLQEGVVSIMQKLQRMGREQMKSLREELEKLLKSEFIVPMDTIELVSLVVVTPKKDGRRWRMCVDFKGLECYDTKGSLSFDFD